MNTPIRKPVNPPAHVMLDIAQAAVDLQHLVMMDQTWTGIAESGDSFGERDREALLVLGTKIHDQLGTIERHVHTLNQFFSTYSAWINERLRSEFAAEFFESSQKEHILKILAVENGNFAERGLALSGSLLERLPVEQFELRKKFLAFRGDDLIVTDVSHETGCGLLALGTMLALMTCPKTGIGCAIAFVEGAALVHYCS
jgi:hypothetical protein